MALKFTQGIRILALVLGGLAFALSPAWGDGTETLGPASVQLETGTGIVAAGVGLRNDPRLPQSGIIDINVLGSVKQVLLYWDGQMGSNVSGDDTIIIEGIKVTGDLIGGPTFLFTISRPGLPLDAYGSAFRADITDLGLVDLGPNSLTVEGLEDFTRLANGAGVLVVFDNPAVTPGTVQVLDGLDFAYHRFPEPRRSTVAQTLTFPAEDFDRTATLSMFFSSVVLPDGPPRPSSIAVTVAGATRLFSNLLASHDGVEHDTLNLLIPIPAGADSLTVQAFSRDDGVPSDPATGQDPASFTWTAAGLSIEGEEEAVGCRWTGGLVVSYDAEDGLNSYRGGGQTGANTALPPQPKGEWTHTQVRGPAGSFTFRGGTASAPEGTEIDEIRCSDPGTCAPSGDPPSPLKQLDFDGIGTFKNIGKRGARVPDFVLAGANVTAEGKGNRAFDGTFHWFEVNIDDLGEPGNTNDKKNPDDVDPELCPPNGFGEKGDQELANCGCSDFYRMSIYDGVDAQDVVKNPDGSIDPSMLNRTDVIYQVQGYIHGGNLQIHWLTGFDRK